MSLVTASGLTPHLNESFVDLQADSRAQDYRVTSDGLRGQASTNFLAVAQNIGGQRFRIGQMLGKAGFRLDQYLYAGEAAASKSRSAVHVFGLPFINDFTPITTTGSYVDAFTGNTITEANFVQNALWHLTQAVKRRLKEGKIVIVTGEIGSTNIPLTFVKYIHEFNLKLRAFAEATPGVYYWNPGAVVWAPATGQIAFVTGTMYDGTTHNSDQGGWDMGVYFWSLFQTFWPVKDQRVNVLSDSSEYQNARQIGRNPRFADLLGGTVTGPTLSSGTVPKYFTLTGLATASVVITSAASADGQGNDVTLAITNSAGAGYVDLGSVVSGLSAFQLTDIVEAAWDVDKAAGSVNATVSAQLVLQSDVGNMDISYGYADPVRVPFTTKAQSRRLRSEPTTFPVGATTKTGFTHKLRTYFTGAGSVTYTVKAHSCERRFVWAESGFAG